MTWETEYRVEDSGVWVYRRSWNYFIVNGQWYRNPEYVYLYHSYGLEA